MCGFQAFDVLERLDSSPELWEAKRGACCGVFQMVVAKRAKKSEVHTPSNDDATSSKHTPSGYFPAERLFCSVRK